MSDTMGKTLDDFGALTEPYPIDAVQYDLRRITSYCKEKGIEPSALTDKELKQFEIVLE
ncbi:MAG: hypothetical protein RR382_12115 [Tannerellaceae bacterium]